MNWASKITWLNKVPGIVFGASDELYVIDKTPFFRAYRFIKLFKSLLQTPTVRLCDLWTAENRTGITNYWYIAGNPEITPQLILRRQLMVPFFHNIASTAVSKPRHQHKWNRPLSYSSHGWSRVRRRCDTQLHTSILLYARTYQYKVRIISCQLRSMTMKGTLRPSRLWIHE